MLELEVILEILFQVPFSLVRKLSLEGKMTCMWLVSSVIGCKIPGPWDSLFFLPFYFASILSCPKPDSKDATLWLWVHIDNCSSVHCHKITVSATCDLEFVLLREGQFMFHILFRKTGMKAYFYFSSQILKMMGLWANDLTYLCLGFLIWKMGIMLLTS